jgi:hypothetical protein
VTRILLTFLGQHLLVILVVGVAGWLEARRWLRRRPEWRLEDLLKRTPYLAVFIAAMVFLYVAAYLDMKFPFARWSTPLWLEYIYQETVWTTFTALTSFIFVLAGTFAFRTRHVERWKLLPVPIIALSIVLTVAWRESKPIYPRLTERLADDGSILQSSGSSCAAAAAANIARQFGIRKTEKEMARIFGTTEEGTTRAQACFGMKQLGLSVHVVNGRTSLAEVRPPAMLYVDAGTPHAIAFLGMRGDQAEIIDPLSGRKLTPPDSIPWEGRAIEFSSP